MNVEDFMISDVVVIHQDETIGTLLKTLVDHKIGGVPVIDDAGKLVGIVSDGDVLRALAPKQQTHFDFYAMVVSFEEEKTEEKIMAVLKDTVKKIMTKRNLQVVYSDNDFNESLKILSHHHFKKIPVIDDERHVVGVISRGDVIRFINRQVMKKLK
ncbi:CBS domain-containing protein [Terrilactibacillus sp. S3-3]|nr:CBS domain-containing protein [Terrilactibacillus sp. S3-3]